jgi:DNA-directed RNA polymerase specialized sigma24 family protein
VKQRFHQPPTDFQQRVEQHMRLSPEQLVTLCERETQRYMQGNPSDGSYALALFQLAIVKQDAAAWQSLYQLYAPLVHFWMKQRRKTWVRLGKEACLPLVDEVFEKFAQAMTAEKIAGFSSLAAVLCYLKMTTRSTLAGALRKMQRGPREDPLESLEQEPLAGDPLDLIGAAESAQELWRDIENHLSSEAERVLLILTWIHEMTPREIQQQAPRLFPSIDDVYRLKASLMHRLRGMSSVQQRRAATLGRPWSGEKGAANAQQ